MPAVRECGNAPIVVLATLSAAQKKLRTLVAELVLSGYDIKIAPQEGLASYIETNLGNPAMMYKAARAILEKHSNACALVLGCTHYVYLRPYLEELTRGTIRLFDGNDGVARRLANIVETAVLVDG